MARPALFQSRAAQVAAHLRERLNAHDWEEWLPAERELATLIGVSRRTIHAALQELQREGLIAKGTRQGTRILLPRAPSEAPPRSVGMLFHNYNPQVKIERIPTLIAIREALESFGVRLDHHRTSYLSGKRVSSSFLELMSKTHHDLWVLSTPTPAIEQWFADQKIPALVYGMGHPEIGLPSFSVDLMATARHATGEILRLGHREIALILPQRLNAEDLQTLRGMEEALTEGRSHQARYQLYQHDESRPSIHRLVQRLLKRSPRPTAWYIGRPEFYISVHCYLQAIGVNIPEEITLISRSGEGLMKHIYPEPARYVTDGVLIAKRCARLIIRLLEGHSSEHQRIMPDFVRGETMGPPREVDKDRHQ